MEKDKAKAGAQSTPNSKVQVDETDVKILALLQKDGRLTYKKIARELSIAIGTVHNRVVRMKKLGVIKKFAPVIDATKLGFTLGALITIRMKSGGFVLPKKIEQHPNVFGVWTVTGEHDNTIFARFRNTEEMSEFLKNLQETESGIDKTTTHVVLTQGKEDFAPNLQAAMHPLFEKKAK